MLAQREVAAELRVLFQQRKVFLTAKHHNRLRQPRFSFELRVGPNSIHQIESLVCDPAHGIRLSFFFHARSVLLLTRHFAQLDRIRSRRHVYRWRRIRRFSWPRRTRSARYTATANSTLCLRLDAVDN